MKAAVIVFPGSNCDQDCVHVLQNVLGHPTRLLWHKESALGDVDAVLVITADASMVRAVAAESCDVILSTSIAP